MDNTARKIGDVWGAMVSETATQIAEAMAPLKLEPPDPEPKKERHISIESEAPRYNGSISATFHANGGVLLSKYTDGASVMLHISAEEWEQLTAKPVEGT